MVLGQVQRSGIQVTSSSTELAATAREQEATMGNQLTSSKKVVASVKEISGLSNELVKTMDQVAAMSQETAGFAATGQSDLGRMEEAMRNMESASKSISGRLETINEKAENITTVVVTITKVADQTNLLSLKRSHRSLKGRGSTAEASMWWPVKSEDWRIRRLLPLWTLSRWYRKCRRRFQPVSWRWISLLGKSSAVLRTWDVSVTNWQKLLSRFRHWSPSFEERKCFHGAAVPEYATEINTAIVNLSEEMQQTMESLHESYSAIEQLNEAARGLQDEVGRFKVG